MDSLHKIHNVKWFERTEGRRDDPSRSSCSHQGVSCHLLQRAAHELLTAGFVNTSCLFRMFHLNKLVLSETPWKAPLTRAGAGLGVVRKESGLHSGALLVHLLGKGMSDTMSTSVFDSRSLRWPCSQGSSYPEVPFSSRTWSPWMVGIERCSWLLRPI